ncbi:transglutaminase domain-containing protein [Cellulomonas sp. APG4]|uniref:transglutaminase family protein n=1 Tax=Cellulomonas sp. APG4 TaxID=1538656 RepID=UPI00137B268A|nr:DUF3488 and transglutaminase-like domain-containing protein [Cellulomonas sp. APG4]NCT92076.1 transglutaminase domain-containing protein [Cellulomonas sp. APG4]
MSPAARTAPVSGARAWVGAGLVSLLVLSGLVSLRALLQDGPWLTIGALATLGLVALLGLLRSRGRAGVAPTTWGLLLTLVALLALYGGRGTTLSVPVPTVETLDRLSRLASNGVQAVVDGRVPVAPGRGLELLVVSGVLVAVLVVDLVALGLGRAGLAGVPVLALFVPAALFDRMPGTLTLLVTGTAYLLLLALTRPSSRAGARTGRTDALPALGAAALVTTLALALTPAAASLPFYGSVRGSGGWGPPAVTGPLRLSTDLDMRSSLAARSDRPLLRYTVADPGVGPLRMYTLSEFDGTRWQRGAEPDADGLTPADGPLWPEGDPLPGDEATPVEMSIEVGDLDQDRLPVPTDPRVVEVSPRWLYDPQRDEVVGDDVRTRGLTYDVELSRRDLSAERLDEDTAGRSLDPTAPTLELPETTHVADVARVAREVTADAESAYDQALALQTYLRDTSTFRYSTQVPAAETDDAVHDFLTSRTGYCVQFATAMAVMARSLGIPARLGVGFLPGRPNPAVRGEFVVTGQQSHAWPELYFDGAGWVRFEPTPAVQTGAPPAYADPFGNAPVATPSATPSATARPTTDPQDAPQEGLTEGRDEVGIGGAAVPRRLVIAVAALLVTTSVLTVWSMLRRRRRRAERPERGPEVAWSTLRERLEPLGVRWSDATTPRQAALMVEQRYAELLAAGRVDEGTVERARRSLAVLVRALEEARYAPRPVEAEPGPLGAGRPRDPDVLVEEVVEAAQGRQPVHA